MQGFVGAGLVGPLAINHIITELKMTEIAVMRSKYLPPSTVFMRGRLRHPFRFYANSEGTVCAIICEITLRMEGLYSLVFINFRLGRKQWFKRNSDFRWSCKYRT